jgi:glycosyltransferase involved in cell wall biosynthesis
MVTESKESNTGLRPASVSVIMPAYNVTRFIGQAIESVLEQTHPAAEVIVVNDGCPDTAALEHRLARFMDRIHYIRRPNGGPGAARNTGIMAALGNLVAFLDADDYWTPDFLERQVGYLAAHPDLDLVYCDTNIFVDSDSTTRSFMTAAPSEGEATLASLLSGRCHVPTSTVVARKSVLIAAGLFNEAIGRHAEDFDLWIRVAWSGGKVGYQREILAYHREHQESLTSRPLALTRGGIKVLEQARRELTLAPAELYALESRLAHLRSDLLVDEAKHHLLHGEYFQAAKKLSQSLQIRPSRKRRLVLVGVRCWPTAVSWALKLRNRTAGT